MNKLTIPNGGMPLHGDDFAWMQDGIQEAIEGALHLFAAPHGGNLILSGCEATISGGAIAYAPGFVLLGHEVLRFEGTTLSNTINDGHKWKLAITYDPAGNDVFADTVARDTYEVRRAIVQDSPTGVDVGTIARMDERIATIAQAGNWTQQVTSFGTGFGGALHVRNTAGTRLLYGTVALSTPLPFGAWTKLAELPSTESRPATDRYMMVPLLGAPSNTGILRIKANGDIEINPLVDSNNYSSVRISVNYL